MRDTIQFLKFQDAVNCSYLHTRTIDAFMQITYKFVPGHCYGISSDFGCGSWGIASCIGGRNSEHYTGKVLLGEKEINPRILSQYSCFIGENTFDKIDLNFNNTPRLCIEQALSLSKLPYTSDQIKQMFYLSNGRFDRDINYISGEIWTVSMAINFSLGKKIYCYPWLNEADIERFKFAYESGIIDRIKKTGGIIIVPSSQKKCLKKCCDYTICIDRKHGIKY